MSNINENKYCEICITVSTNIFNKKTEGGLHKKTEGELNKKK